MSSILIRDAMLIATFDDESRIERNADLYIEGPEIKAIGQGLQVDANEIIDASHMIVLPGLINTHTLVSDPDPQHPTCAGCNPL